MRPHVEPPSAHHLSCSSLNSSSFPLFHSFCLSDYVSVCIHPCRQGSLNDRSDSFSAFIVMWLRRFSMRCKRRDTTKTTSSVSVSLNVSRQNAESSRLILRRSLNHNPWQWGSRSFFVSCDLLRQLPRTGTQAFPVRRSVSVLSNFCLAQLRSW